MISNYLFFVDGPPCRRHHYSILAGGRGDGCLPVTLVTHGFSDSRSNDMSEVINLVPPAAQNAEEHARADTQRNKQLFDWADGVLRSLGLDKAIAAAKSIQELGQDHARCG